ncbi:PREDICTED: uncharacterized protein LOC108559990 isoform X2 [Nicrophorus vespilloides]|uniref:Uncharacterized protein LOC108559990 isoform X2 n=1 Tax=Nicrophorus vespilloides TaxID=110193 RepID=A0ABM1ME85_NICVS|nr:PREDICTED: uncharacterized protein LOC108559990 isoform X2 [Nicrophorus vespilloides]
MACLILFLAASISQICGLSTELFPQNETIVLPPQVKAFANALANTIEALATYPFRSSAEIFGVIFRFVGNYLNSTLEFKYTWIFKYADAIGGRVFNMTSSWAPAVLRGFLLVFIPNLDEIGGNLGDAILKLTTTINNPLSAVPGYNFVNGLFGSKNPKPGVATQKPKVTTKKPEGPVENPGVTTEKTGILGWLG